VSLWAEVDGFTVGFSASLDFVVDYIADALGAVVYVYPGFVTYGGVFPRYGSTHMVGREPLTAKGLKWE